MNQTNTYKGIDLLDKIFEFSAMTPDNKSWTLSGVAWNQPRLIRLKQINSLIDAFFPMKTSNNFIDKAKQLFSNKENDTTIHTILSGDFLEKQNINDYSELIKFIKTFVKTKESFEREERELHILDLSMPYQQLIEYKKLLRQLLTFNSGWLEASSITSIFSIYFTNSIANNFKDHSELDKVLEMFINPKNLSFTEDELIAKYNFPRENLDEIDSDNW